MTQVTYISQFDGRFEPANDNGTVLKTKMRAPCQIAIDDRAKGTRQLLEDAEIESTMIYTGETSFQQYGTITFANSNGKLYFSTKGPGRIADVPSGKVKLGSAVLQIDNGRGWFGNASGLITSNFVVNDNGEVTDSHVGIVHVV